MPSPVGHSLAGIAVGWAVGRPARPTRALVVQVLTLAAIGVAPDLDLLWGRHSYETHSIGAAVMVASVAAWRRWPVGPQTRVGIFATVCLAWLIHPALDMFSMDNNPPIGVMLWWPFSSGFVHATPFFDPISRYWSRPETWPNNFAAAGRELLLIAPVAFVIWLVRRGRP
jgi:hypothetical protein